MIRYAISIQQGLFTAAASSNRNSVIKDQRVVFKWLPVWKYCHANDLVQGSYWFMWGSLVSAIVPIIPLIDIYTNGRIFNNIIEDVEGINLPETWILLILSGILFLFGSICFIRSFTYPSIEPLFKGTCIHFSTDDLVGAYAFWIGSLLLIPISIVYIAVDPYEISYWASFIAATVFMIGSGFFVYCCYPTTYTDPFFFPLFLKWFGHYPRLIKCLEIHCCNDWLVTCWLFYLASLVWLIGSVFMLIYICVFKNSNSKEIYLYSSSIFDSILFLVGSLYYIAGSYHLDVLTSNSQRSQQTDKDIDLCFEQKSESYTEKLIDRQSKVLI